MNPTTPPPPSGGRRLSAICLGLYCVFNVVMGIPNELSPRFLREQTTPLRELFNDYGHNPWHFVFPGGRGTNKRRNVAVRYTGITTTGERVVLHEAPQGLTGPHLRVFDDARTTVSIKIFSLVGIGRVMLHRNDARWQEAMGILRARGPVKRSILGFCNSDTLNGGRQLESVELDLFTAGISYESGEQYGRASKLLLAKCDQDTVFKSYGEAPKRPDWPGVEWRPVQ